MFVGVIWKVPAIALYSICNTNMLSQIRTTTATSVIPQIVSPTNAKARSFGIYVSSMTEIMDH